MYNNSQLADKAALFQKRFFHVQSLESLQLRVNPFSVAVLSLLNFVTGTTRRKPVVELHTFQYAKIS